MKNHRTVAQSIRTSLVLPACLGFLVLGCTDDGEDTIVEQAEEAGTEELIVGDIVTITGEVQTVVSPTSFTMGGGDTLVYSADALAVDPGDEVSATGVVVEFLIADVETRLDFDFDDDLYIDYENELALEATDVMVLEEA